MQLWALKLRGWMPVERIPHVRCRPSETVNSMIPSRHRAVTVEGAECGEVMRNGEGRRQMVWPGDDGNTEPAIKVLMDRDRVVVRPVGHFDADSLRALVDLVGCARAAGVVAVVELDGIELGDRAGSGVVARLVADGSQSPSSRS